jgi:hypothetical protein
MATTYYYNAYLQQEINKNWCTLLTANTAINANRLSETLVGTGARTACRWVIQVYSLSGGTKTLLDNNVVTVSLPSKFSKYFSQVETVNGNIFRANLLPQPMPEHNWQTVIANTGSKKFLVNPAFDVKVNVNNVTTQVSFQPFSQDEWNGLGVGVPYPTGAVLSTPPTTLQSITVTAAAKEDPAPLALIKLLNPNLQPQYKPNLSQAQYDAVNKWWVAIVETVKPPLEPSYTAYYYNPGSTGTLIKKENLGSGKAGKLAGQGVLIDAVDSKKNTSIKTPVTGQGTTTYKASAQVEPTSDIRWNPDPHNITRSPSRGFKFQALTRKVEAPAESSEKFINEAYVQVDPTNYYGVPGRIIQDANSAQIANPKGDSKPWGFKFTYNPTTIQYNNQGNTTVDWTLSNADPAALIGGNLQVTFQLYLNRIVDMTQLAKDPSKGYPTVLGKEAVEGILNRGTEYDIEFLYRACNGSPDKTIKNPMLSYNGLSSDIGILKMLPVWLHINDNMKFYGSVASISVNHAMFTPTMIPILSTVDITFLRYPAIFGTSSQSTDAAVQSYATAAGLTFVKDLATGNGGTTK